VNGEESRQAELLQAGLPQGSPLSPILFLFFNANLLQGGYNGRHGSIAFVDDYTAWVIGKSIEDNLRVIQQHIIPRVEQWEQESGTTFEAEKTKLMHFKKRGEIPRSSVTIKGQEVEAEEAIKILGVILDTHLSWSMQAAYTATKGKKAALALKRLKGLWLQTACQLYKATVAPVLDYGSPIWYPLITNKNLGKLEQAQAIGVQAVISSFHTVALSITEAEAGVEPIPIRLENYMHQFWLNAHMLPEKHPFWTLKRSISLTNKCFVSPLQAIAQRFQDMDLTRLERIKPFCEYDH